MLPAEWRSRLRAAREVAYFLDFDGTLAPIRQDPAAVTVDPAAARWLERAGGRPGTWVAIISGRSVADLGKRVDPGARLPLLLAGNHGFEVADRAGWPGLKEGLPLPEGARAAPAVVERWIGRVVAGLEAALPGIPVELRRPGEGEGHGSGAGRGACPTSPRLLLEAKGITASLHLRGHPLAVAGVARRCAQQALAGLEGVLELREGKEVLEVRPAVEWDKGACALHLLAAGWGPRWWERVLAVGVGDDHTDEDLFCRIGGHGSLTVRVGPGPTRARLTLRGQEAVAPFLEETLEARGD